MSQQDCFDWLKEQHEVSPYRWFRVKDVQQGLEAKGLGNGTIQNVSTHLLKLSLCDDVLMRGVGIWEHYKEFKIR